MKNHICIGLSFSALRDVKIPPGPRLVILDHIKRFGIIAVFLASIVLVSLISNILCCNFAENPAWQNRIEVIASVHQLFSSICINDVFEIPVGLFQR
jgi:ubiquitin C-terminal hydrolase